MQSDLAALQRIIDERDITAVLHAYCRGIDRHDVDRVRECFHPDAIDDHGVYRGSIDGLLEMAGQTGSTLGGLQRTVHSLSNIMIDIADDRAVSESQVLAYHEWLTPEGRQDEFIGGRYLDRFERRAQRWKISERLCVFEWSRIAPVTQRFWERVPGAYTMGASAPSDPLYALLARLR